MTKKITYFLYFLLGLVSIVIGYYFWYVAISLIEALLFLRFLIAAMAGFYTATLLATVILLSFISSWLILNFTNSVVSSHISSTKLTQRTLFLLTILSLIAGLCLGTLIDIWPRFFL